MGKTYCKTPTVFQMEAVECGAASFAMICSYWGKYVPLEQMRIETGVSRDGCSAGNIMRAAKRFGMECRAYRKEPESLRDLPMPCIIHWNFNHFVVFEGFKGKHAYINDPAFGRRKIELSELDECFTGVVLTFKPTEKFEKHKKENKIIPLIKERLRGSGKVIGQLIIVGILLILPGLIVPALSQVFIDRVLGSSGVSWFTQFIVFFVATLLFSLILSLYRSHVLLRLQNRLVLLSSRGFLNHLFRLPVSFFSQRYTGDLIGRIENNDNLNEFLTSELAETVLNIIVAVFYLVLLVAYSPLLTLIGCVGIVVNVVIIKFSSDYFSNMTLKLQQDKGKLSGVVCSGLSVTSTLKASGAESAYSSRVLGYEAKAFVQEQKISKLQTIVSAIPNAIDQILVVMLLVVGSMFIVQGDMTMGMVTAFISLFGSFADPVNDLVGFAQRIQTLKADIERVDDIMRYPQDSSYANDDEKNRSNKKISGAVEFKDVTFGYSTLAAPLIENFSFSVAPGGTVALVGSSGCGKSTVSKIASGLYAPWDGELLLDGMPSSSIDAQARHASIATVSQHVSVFSGTIRDNLTLWNPAVLESDMIKAAKDACIHETITQKPGAYDYQLAEGGANLSGGQRQRLEIARALATNPTILILDEATSALDPITEKEIVENIKRRGCTCIVVAHRLSAVRNSDEILVMDRGSIIERGTHEELVGLRGRYYELMSAM